MYIKIGVNPKKMAVKDNNQKQQVTLSIDSRTYDSYKRYCEEHAIMLSKKIELFMKKELEESKE